MTANKDHVSGWERVTIAEAGELAGVSLETSRRRRQHRLARERRRDRIAGAVVVLLGAACVWLGVGGPAWPH